MPTARTFQLDIDTKRYCNRVNIFRLLNGVGPLLPPDVTDIDNFVVGLKDLGVWTNTVCWLMGSRYNVGVGTTALSMNNIYDATLVSSPTWNPNWIDTSPTNSYMLIPYNHINRKSDTGSIVTGLANFASNYGLISSSDGTNGWECGARNSTTINYAWKSGTSITVTRAGLNLNNPQFMSFWWSGGAVYTRWNLTNATSTSPLEMISTRTHSQVGRSNTSQAAVKCSFLLYMKNYAISNAAHDSLESLAKTSIGKYLSLP